MEKSISSSLKNRMKYDSFINSSNNSIVIDNKVIDRENVFNYYTSLSIEEKNKLTIYELNIIYYLFNEYFKKYVTNKNTLISIIDNYILFSNRSEALKTYNYI